MCTGRVQAAALLNEIAENEVLKCAVLLFIGNSARDVALVDIFGLSARGIAESGRAEVGDFKLHRNAATLGIVLQHLTDEFQIVAEHRGKLADIFLLHPAVQHFFLQRNVDAFVGIARRLVLVVERPHERVGKEDPGKPFGIEVVGHHGAVRHGCFNVDLVENRIEVGRSRELLLQLRLLVEQPFCMLRREVGVGISEQGFGRDRKFGIVVTGAQRFAGVRRRCHRVDVRIVGVPGMRVVVERRNLFNLRKQALVDLLHVGAGKGRAWAMEKTEMPTTAQKISPRIADRMQFLRG